MVAVERDYAQTKGFIAPPGYRRHRPEATLLHALVAEHYPAFRDRRAAEGRPPKLTPAQIARARTDITAGRSTIPDLAAAFGVAPRTLERALADAP